jgi:predicted Zn-dependent peptidase
MSENKEMPDHIKALVSGCLSAMKLVEKNELAYAAGMFSCLLEETLYHGTGMTEEQYQAFRSELEQLVCKYIDEGEKN